jgi:hypothetical protein
MLRQSVSAALVLVLAASFGHTADVARKKPAKKPKVTRVKVVKVEGDLLTVVQKKQDRTYKLTPDTRYVLHGEGKNQTLTADEGKKRLTGGERVRLKADATGAVKAVHFGSGKKAKKPKTTQVKVVKVEGDTLIVVRKKEEKSYTLTQDTKYVLHGEGKQKTLTADEGKKRLTGGVRVRIEADAAGSVKAVHFGSGKKAKKPKKT